MPEATPAPSGGSTKPKAKGKTPTWYYVAGAVALVGVYYFWSKSKASTAAASTTAAGAGTSSGAGTAAGSYGNAGDLAALAPYLNQGSSSTSTSGASYTAPSNLASIGSGYGINTGSSNPSTTPIPSASGANYVQVSSANIQQLAAAGQQVYYQPAPGVFSPIPAGSGQYNLGGLAGNTPLFINQGSGA